MPTYRKEKVSEAIRQIISEKIAKEKSLLPGGIITINRVEVSEDFSVAKVYYTFFGNDKISENEVSSNMKEAEPEFRFEVSKKLNLRRTPKISFCYDKNTEYAFKINKMFEDL